MAKFARMSSATIIAVSITMVFLITFCSYLQVDPKPSHSRPRCEESNSKAFARHTMHDESRNVVLDTEFPATRFADPVTVQAQGDDSASASSAAAQRTMKEEPVMVDVVIQYVRRFVREEVRKVGLHRDPTALTAEDDSWEEHYFPGLNATSKSVLRELMMELHNSLQAEQSHASAPALQSSTEHGEDPSSRPNLSEPSPSNFVADVDPDHVETAEFKFLEYGDLTLRRLVVFSAHRISMREFQVVTLSPTAVQQGTGPLFNVCSWISDGSTANPGRFRSDDELKATGRSPSANGFVTLNYVQDTHGLPYDVLVIRCQFPDPVGADFGGGFLYLNVSHGEKRGVMSSELVPVHRERPGKVNPSSYESTTFEYEYGYCSQPVWSKLSASNVKQWFMFHHALLEGKVHYYMYDNIGIDDETMAVLQPMIDAGAMTMVNLIKGLDYESHYHSQALAMNDCLGRARFAAKWVMFFDFDEYLNFPPPLTLPSLLEQHKDLPWISFGNLWFSRVYCAPPVDESEWAVERMVFRLKDPMCGDVPEEARRTCAGEMGHRKWIANPRKVMVGSIHKSLVPLDSGLNLDTQIARVNHYSGLAVPFPTCDFLKDPAQFDDDHALDHWWWKDDSLVAIARTMRSNSRAYGIFGLKAADDS